MLAFGKLCVHFLNTLQAIQLTARLFLFEFEIPFLLTLLHLQFFTLQAGIQFRLHDDDSRLTFRASQLQIATHVFQFLFLQDRFPLVVPRLATHLAGSFHGGFDAAQLLLMPVGRLILLPLDLMLPCFVVLIPGQSGKIEFLFQRPHLHGVVQIDTQFTKLLLTLNVDRGQQVLAQLLTITFAFLISTDQGFAFFLSQQLALVDVGQSFLKIFSTLNFIQLIRNDCISQCFPDRHFAADVVELC